MAEMRFEEALKRLEKIVGDLEKGDLSLDDALERYEEGIKLARLCEKRLEVAKKKVEILLKSEDGSVEVKPFDEKLAEEPEAKEPASKRKKKEGELF
jgi:exodeoxyribonuclease VII small subunit